MSAMITCTEKMGNMMDQHLVLPRGVLETPMDMYPKVTRDIFVNSNINHPLSIMALVHSMDKGMHK